jgi:hypothetical protein
MLLQLGQDKQSAVSLLVAAAIIPLVISVGLAVDYSFYVEAQSELSLAADTASIEAVRDAVANFTAGSPPATAGIAGALAGQQWFAAQLGTLRTGAVGTPIIPPVAYNAATSTFTATVSYSGQVPTHFGGLLHITSWPIQGTSTAVITTNSYSEVVMLVDNSSSMLIGATQADILALDNATMCAPTPIARAAQQSMSAYSYSYNNGYGYGSKATIPTKSNFSASGAQCDPRFDGGATYCPYPPYMPSGQSTEPNPTLDAAGYCPNVTTNGMSSTTGIPDNSNPKIIDPVTNQTANIPQAPCAFACHTDTGTDDYFTVARNTPGVQLRFDVIQKAAQVVVETMESQAQIANQFSLGVYQFNDSVSQVYPASGGPFVESSTNLPGGASAISNIQTPIVSDNANTNFPGAINYLATNLKPAGDGNTPLTPRKNIFIVTDGLEDYPPGNGRVVGQMTNPTNEQYCSQLKSLGFNVFVLYTPYYPLPNPFYLNNAKNAVEPTVPPAASNPVVAALQACATKPTQFYEASSPTDITNAMLAMLASALNTPARIAS